MRFIPLATAPLLLGACQVIDCEICHEGNAALPVIDENISRMRVLSTERGLPMSATNVHYLLRCGIDCNQFIRFDAPPEDARAFADSLLVEHPITPGANPWGINPWSTGTPVWDRVIALGWWPRQFPTDIAGGENTQGSRSGNLIRIGMVTRGGTSRVWVQSYTI